ncbi:MAG: hypothetical protein J6K77_03990 [Ruminococcus sp.]|nr:hypothetical protein [Ruminococcus sp.]
MRVKRICCLAMAAAMTCGLAACGNKKSDDADSRHESEFRSDEESGKENSGQESETRNEEEPAGENSGQESETRNEEEPARENSEQESEFQGNEEPEDKNTFHGSAMLSREKPEGIYFTLDANFDFYKDYTDDFDGAIKDHADENAGYYSIDFDGDNATIFYQNSRVYEYNTYLAGYEIDEKTGKFNFEYRSMERRHNDDIWSVAMGDEAEDLREEALLSMLENLNATGGMPVYSLSWTSKVDKIVDFAIIPKSTRSGAINFEAREEAPANLYNMGDVLCTDIYGFEFDGKYVSGENFTLNFDQYKALEDGPMIIDHLEYVERAITSNYYSDYTDSTIEFEDGKWMWYNHEGNLINNGEYKESEEYNGLIAMYLTDASYGVERKLFEIERCINKPIFLYFADDGEVYYPAFVKEK